MRIILSNLSPFLFLFFLFISQNIVAQNATLNGKVTDAVNGEVLLGATVRAGVSGAITDAAGSFSLSLAPGSYEISISYTGYTTKTITVRLATG